MNHAPQMQVAAEEDMSLRKNARAGLCLCRVEPAAIVPWSTLYGRTGHTRQGSLAKRSTVISIARPITEEDDRLPNREGCRYLLRRGSSLFHLADSQVQDVWCAPRCFGSSILVAVFYTMWLRSCCIGRCLSDMLRSSRTLYNVSCTAGQTTTTTIANAFV